MPAKIPVSLTDFKRWGDATTKLSTKPGDSLLQDNVRPPWGPS